MSSDKPIRIYMGGFKLGVNTLYRLFCFFKLFPMVGKGLNYIIYVAYTHPASRRLCNKKWGEIIRRTAVSVLYWYMYIVPPLSLVLP